MDRVFNRQRYGVNDTSFIMASSDGGITWALGEGAPGETAHTGPHAFFRGRLASPRLINAGQGYRAAPDPAHIYALFPGTTTDAAYFAQNDAIWLGRVPTAKLLDRSAWQFFAGMSAGAPSWTVDDRIAVPVFEHALMTATQQVGWLAGWPCLALVLARPRRFHRRDAREAPLPALAERALMMHSRFRPRGLRTADNVPSGAQALSNARLVVVRPRR